MSDIKIAMIQSNLIWEDTDRNISDFNYKIESITEAVDIILLPEMFNTGFTMNPVKCAEEMDGKTMNWLMQKAEEKKSTIVCSLIIKEGNDYYNRLIWMHSNGNFQTYDKRHLFRLGNENNYYKQGKSKLIVNINQWKFSPYICYDLRFPVWTKNRLIEKNDSANTLMPSTYNYEYDCLIYIANWTVIRKYAWKALLIARAIENQAYVIGVNRIGKDGNGMAHSGNSMAVDFKGNIICECEENIEDIRIINLSLTELNQFRKTFNFALDWDSFTLSNE